MKLSHRTVYGSPFALISSICHCCLHIHGDNWTLWSWFGLRYIRQSFTSINIFENRCFRCTHSNAMRFRFLFSRKYKNSHLFIVIGRAFVHHIALILANIQTISVHRVVRFSEYIIAAETAIRIEIGLYFLLTIRLKVIFFLKIKCIYSPCIFRA